VKIAEVRRIVEGYSPDDLRLIIAEMYKLIPKTLREEKSVDDLVENPTGFAEKRRGRQKTRSTENVDVASLEDDINMFIDYAYKQYYFAPNSYVSKKKRPKWRFKVMRFYKQLSSVRSDSEDALKATQLLESIYKVICHGCRYVIFSGDDPFRSIQIKQSDFLHQVLVRKREMQPPAEFVSGAVDLLLLEGFGKETVPTSLIKLVVDLLPSPEMKEMAIGCCDQTRKKVFRELRSLKASKKLEWSKEYALNEKLSKLAELGFFCYTALQEVERAIDYYWQHSPEKDPEVKLYVLLERLTSLRLKDQWINVYEKAVASGIKPRKVLQETYQYISANDVLPKYIGYHDV